MNRLFISAAHKSSGKTTLSIGLCAAFSKHGHTVQPFKKGPDYIDPLWLSAASGRACHNLDFNTMTHDEIRFTLAHYAKKSDIAIIEANKGLFDGVALDGSDSNAALAKLTQSPIILVINTVGTTRGVAPLLLGYQAFDPQLPIAGVIFNLVGGARHETKLRQITETYTDIPVLGAVHKHPEMQIEERHLGLMPSNEQQQAHQQIQKIAHLVEQQVDLQQLIHISQSAPPAPSYHYTLPEKSQQTKVRIGICRDAAFAFYYPSDLMALERAGAELIRIDTLQDKQLANIDGLFIGGGFPETQMTALAANQGLRQQIKQAIENGLPCYAECGGLMYLAENIIWQGQSAPMVGVIPADVVMHQRPQGRGYIRLKETTHMPWANNPTNPQTHIIHAHEFHYSRLENLREKGNYAYEVIRGDGIDGQYDGWVYKNLLASYAHMRDTSQYHWAQRFVDFVRTHAT